MIARIWGFLRAASAISSASASDMAIGFSAMRCFPAESVAMYISRWVGGGVVMQRRSTSGWATVSCQSSVTCSKPNFSPTDFAFSSRALASDTSLNSSLSANAGIWTLRANPVPMTPTPIFFILTSLLLSGASEKNLATNQIEQYRENRERYQREAIGIVTRIKRIELLRPFSCRFL